jgi:hypothetical protein
MSQLQMLRKWAAYNGLEIVTTSNDGGQWWMTVNVEKPIKFQAASKWQPTTEEAAAKVIEQLEEIGEDLNVT